MGPPTTCHFHGFIRLRKKQIRNKILILTNLFLVISLSNCLAPPRFDFSHRRQQQTSPFQTNGNLHHFQRQQLNSDPLLSVTSSNVNANFNQHFTRPYVRSPTLNSSSNNANFPRFGASSNIFSQEHVCGYDSCHETNPNSLNIHIVCHTHLDTGWVETYDEYYHHCKCLF